MKINNLNVISQIQNYENKDKKIIKNEVNDEIKTEGLTEREKKIIDIKNKIQNYEYQKLDMKELSKIIVDDLF